MQRDQVPASSEHRSLVCGLVAIATLAGSAALAQQSPVRPGVEGREPALSQSERRAIEDREGAAPLGAAGPAVDRMPERPAGGPTLLLTDVAVSGAQSLPADALEPAYRPFVGRTVSVDELSALAEALSQAYRGRGFHLSRALIPQQDLAAGRLRVAVVEGAITEIVVRGDADGRHGIAELLAPIAREQPSSRRTLERQLLLVNERPGVMVTDTTIDEIEPSSGRFRLTVTVRTWDAYAAVGADNLGSRAVGPWQVSGNAALNSILFPGDTLSVAGTTVPNASRELRFGRVSYDAPIGIDSFRVGASVATSHVWPGDHRRWTRTWSKADSYEARVSYAPILTQAHSVWLTGALGLVDAREQNEFGPAYKDRVRIASLTADYKANLVPGGWSYLSATYKQALGFDGFADRNRDWVSRFGASGHFAVFGASLTHYQNLAESWSLKLAAAGQVASGPLLLSQQYYLGGNWFGRGLPSGWISGDDALAGSLELRYDGVLKDSFAKGYQLYAFVEGGGTRSKLEPRDFIQSVASVGAGVRVFLTDEIQLGVGIAKPIVYRSPTNHDRGVAVMFSISNAVRLCPSAQGVRCGG